MERIQGMLRERGCPEILIHLSVTVEDEKSLSSFLEKEGELGRRVLRSDGVTVVATRALADAYSYGA